MPTTRPTYLMLSDDQERAHIKDYEQGEQVSVLCGKVVYKTQVVAASRGWTVCKICWATAKNKGLQVSEKVP